MRADGIGYPYGIGAIVTQLTSRTTGVTLNNLCGQITLFSAAGSATPATFTVTNSRVTADSVVVACQRSGTDSYRLDVTNVTDGAFNITFADLTGTTAEAPVFAFMVFTNDIN